MIDRDLAALVRERLCARLAEIAARIPAACAASVRAGTPPAEALRAATARAVIEIDRALAEADLALAEAARARRQ
jgi:hypothetical protein